MNIEIGIGIGKGSLSSLSSSDRLIAYAWAFALKPNVFTSSVVHVSINVVPASSGSSALSPSVSNAGNVTVLSVIANAINTAVIPTVSGIRNVSINSVIANMIANGIVPTLSFDGNPSINAVTANSTASSSVPTISTGGATTDYLQMDGVDDYITIPALAEIRAVMEIQVESIVVGVLWNSAGNFSLTLNANGTETYNASKIGEVKVDGVVVTNNTSFIPRSKKITIEMTLLSQNSWSNFVFTANNAVNNYVKGNIYSLKYYNASNVLLGNYDMSTGTVLDQSGRGKHATLTGGTWVVA
jgi:hypothetical protein